MIGRLPGFGDANHPDAYEMEDPDASGWELYLRRYPAARARMESESRQRANADGSLAEARFEAAVPLTESTTSGVSDQ